MESVTREVDKTAKKGRAVTQGTLGAVAAMLTAMRATRAALVVIENDVDTKANALQQLAAKSAEIHAKCGACCVASKAYYVLGLCRSTKNINRTLAKSAKPSIKHYHLRAPALTE